MPELYLRGYGAGSERYQVMAEDGVFVGKVYVWPWFYMYSVNSVEDFGDTGRRFLVYGFGGANSSDRWEALFGINNMTVTARSKKAPWPLLPGYLGVGGGMVNSDVVVPFYNNFSRYK